MYRVEKQPRNEAERRLYAGFGGRLAKAVDVVLSPFAPKFVLQRQRARAGIVSLLNYDAASSKRTRRTQKASSADQDLLLDLPKLRENSRAMCRDDSAAAAMVRVLEDNVIGTGLRPQMLLDPELAGLTDKEADAWCRSCERLFDEWAGAEADATETDSFWDLQRQVLRSVVMDGEALLHRTWVENSAGRSLATAYELIDVDRLQDPHGSTLDVRSGVELGERAQPVAYWVTPRHPADQAARWKTTRLQRNQPERWARSAAGQASVLHVFRRDRSGQTRGIPFFAPSFGLVEAMNDMLETELNAARAASKFCAFIKQTLDLSSSPQLEQDRDGVWHEKLESATIRYLNDGEELVPYTPNRPGNNFEPFVVRVLRSICASLNLPYEMVLKDFGGMNYSSARVALLEARRGFEVLQQLIIQKLCQPVLRSVIWDGVTSGRLRMPRGFLAAPQLFLRAFWQPPAWGWVDPVKEIQASSDAVANNLSTPQAEAARQGMDFDTIIEMRCRAIARIRETAGRYGIDPLQVMPPARAGAALPPAAGDDANDDDKKAEEKPAA